MKLQSTFHLDIIRRIYAQKYRAITFGGSYLTLNELLLLIESNLISIKIIEDSERYIKFRVLKHEQSPIQSCMYTLNKVYE